MSDVAVGRDGLNALQDNLAPAGTANDLTRSPRPTGFVLTSLEPRLSLEQPQQLLRTEQAHGVRR
jgi:hypothetical protein